jgi:hypothetical protein
MKNVVSDAKQVQLQKEQLLLEMSNGMASAKDIEQLIILTMHQAKNLVDADRASLFLIDSKTQDCYTYVAENTEPIIVKKGIGLIGTCVDSGIPLNINDARKDRRFNKSNDRKTGYTTKEVLCVPLKDSTGSVIGALQVINRSKLNNILIDDNVDESKNVLSNPNKKNVINDVQPFTKHELSCLERMGIQVEKIIQDILKTKREGKWKLHRFIQRWNKAGLTKTWNNWLSYIKDGKRLKALTERSMLLWSKRISRMAMSSWVYYYETRKHQRTLMKRVFARMTKVQLNIGFQTWYRYSMNASNSLSNVRNQVGIVLESTCAMLSITSIEEASTIIKSSACQLLSASKATLYLVDQQRMLAWAYITNSSELHRVPFGHGVVGRMAQGGDGGSFVYNSSDEEDASVLCIGIPDGKKWYTCYYFDLESFF